MSIQWEEIDRNKLYDRNTFIWSAASIGHTETYAASCDSLDRRLIATANERHSFSVFNRETNQVIRSGRSHPVFFSQRPTTAKWRGTIGFSLDGSYVIFSSHTTGVGVCYLFLDRMHPSTMWFTPPRYVPKGLVVLSGRHGYDFAVANKDEVHLYNVKRESIICRISVPGFRGYLFDLHGPAGGNTLVAHGSNRRKFQWNISEDGSGQPVIIRHESRCDMPSRFAITRDGNTAVSLTHVDPLDPTKHRNGVSRLTLFRPFSGRLCDIKEVHLNWSPVHEFTRMSISSDEKSIAIFRRMSPLISVFSLEDLSLLFMTSVPKLFNAQAVCFDPDADALDVITVDSELVRLFNPLRLALVGFVGPQIRPPPEAPCKTDSPRSLPPLEPASPRPDDTESQSVLWTHFGAQWMCDRRIWGRVGEFLKSGPLVSPVINMDEDEPAAKRKK